MFSRTVTKENTKKVLGDLNLLDDSMQNAQVHLKVFKTSG